MPKHFAVGIVIVSITVYRLVLHFDLHFMQCPYLFIVSVLFSNLPKGKIQIEIFGP